MTSYQLLCEHHLKRTSCREGILDIMIHANEALSENEIRELLSGNYDRTTFYRSFKTLEEKKIIHKIVVDNQTVKYAIKLDSQAETHHAHFYCQQCKTVQCLDNVIIETPTLPDGFQESETNIMIKGICKQCNQH